MKRGVSRFSVENFWSHSAEKVRGHPFNVSENLGYRKILCIIGGIAIFRRKLIVSQCRKIAWTSLQCFRKFEVSKNFMRNRGYHNFPSKTYCLTVPKNCVDIPSMFQKIWGIEKCYAYWGVSRFSVEKIWSHSAEKFRGHPFNASKNLGYRKMLCILRCITFFRRKILVSQCRKISWTSLQCFRKFEVSKNFMHNRGYHNFPS